MSLKRLLSRHSKLYALLRRVRYELAQHWNRTEDRAEIWEKARRFAKENSAYCQIFDNGQFKTIFTSEYRLSALDLQDPRIAEGLRLSLEAIRRMRQYGTERKIRFIVLLIPTKEFVFRELVQQPAGSFQTLISNEELFRHAAREFFEIHGIEYVDALPALRHLLSRGNQPYQMSEDGHLNELGHAVIASVVNAQIKNH